MKDLPNFLVIGAQKCGTTTLYEDLRSHARIFIPDKESSGLLSVENPGDVHTYSRMFRGHNNAITGEVATTYSMLPDIDAVTRARRVFRQVKVIYIVRNPIDRVISHHHHDVTIGLMSDDIDVEVRRSPQLVGYSRYASQISPWYEAFGPDHVRVVRFEDYMATRQQSANDLYSFLGLAASQLPAPSARFNAADTKVVAVGKWKHVSNSRAYRRVIRPVLPERLRKRAMRRVLPHAPERPAPPNRATLEYLRDELTPEVEELARLVDADPWWDLAETVEEITQRS